VNGSLWERFMRWLCKTFGHRTYIDYTSTGGGDPEICYRCNALVSTACSRAALRQEESNG
jgi:hypothetical protein